MRRRAASRSTGRGRADRPAARQHAHRPGGTLLGLAALALVLQLACEERGREPPDPRQEDRSADRGAEPDRAAPEPLGDSPAPAAEAPAERPDGYECLVPDLPVPRTAACARGLRYPECRYQLPAPADAAGLYAIWRNTVPEHRWGREALVRLVLATARDYAARFAGETITVGDLDAPGPRHRTHRSGVDVDLYLPGKMATDNRGARDYPSNYDGRPEAEVEASRARVLELAKIVTACAGGAVRIYYNDAPVVERYSSWFEASGLDSPFGRPMEPHNLLHLFHLHVGVVRALEPLPIDGRPGQGLRAPAVAPRPEPQ